MLSPNAQMTAYIAPPPPPPYQPLSWSAYLNCPRNRVKYCYYYGVVIILIIQERKLVLLLVLYIERIKSVLREYLEECNKGKILKYSLFHHDVFPRNRLDPTEWHLLTLFPCKIMNYFLLWGGGVVLSPPNDNLGPNWARKNIKTVLESSQKIR